MEQDIKTIKYFDRELWVIDFNNKEVRYENMRKSLKEMDVLKAPIDYQ
jgi:hypothetical protein